jgi:hypothetical protein
LIGFETLSQSAAANRLRVEQMNSVSSDHATAAGATSNLVPGVMTLKIVKDATHRTYYYANGAGLTYTQFLQEAASTWLTETDVGIGGVNNGTGWTCQIELLNWSLT